MQPASVDIWDKKYRLKTKQGEALDADIDGTYQRVARALADAEPMPTSAPTGTNASWARCVAGPFPPAASPRTPGARAQTGHQHDQLHRVGTITDSMDGIPDKVHEAGLTLKAGCGIGYEFSTLRPRGAVRRRRRRLHLRPDVLHGYLRQDVLHRVSAGGGAARRWARSTSRTRT